MPKRSHKKTTKTYRSTITDPSTITLSSPVLEPAPKSRVLPLVIILVLVISGSLYYYLKVSYPFLFTTISNKIVSIISFSPAPSPSVSPSPIPKSTPKPIPHGLTSFTVGQGDKTVPQLSKGTIDPYDPEIGTTQTVTISVQNPRPITEVSAILITDHTATGFIVFKLISGTNMSGVWQASWPITDSYLYRYALTLNAVSDDKKATVDITLR